MSIEDRWLGPDELAKWKILYPRYRELDEAVLQALRDHDLERVEELASEFREVVAELGEVFGLPTALDDST